MTGEANDLFNRLKRILGTVDARFADNEMQDSMECIFVILNRIKEYHQVPTVCRRVTSNEPNWVEETFFHEVVETFECISCGWSKDLKGQVEMGVYLDLENDVRPGHDQHTSLQSLFTESFGQEERDVRCTFCGGSKAMSTRKISRLPRVLSLYAKRFRNHARGKDSRPVEIPEFVNVSEVLGQSVRLPDRNAEDKLVDVLHIGRKSLKDEEFKYKLSSVVSHFGVGMNSGHYVADVLRSNLGGLWFHCDDERTTLTNSHSVR